MIGGFLARRRSIGFPVTLGVVLTIVALALAVGWQVLVFSDARAVARELVMRVARRMIPEVAERRVEQEIELLKRSVR